MAKERNFIIHVKNGLMVVSIKEWILHYYNMHFLNKSEPANDKDLCQMMINVLSKIIAITINVFNSDLFMDI